MPPIAEQALLSPVWEWLTELVNNPERVQMALYERATIDGQRTIHLRNRLAEIEAQLGAFDVQVKRLFETFAVNPDVPLEWLGEHKAQLARLCGDFEHERATIVAQLEREYYTPQRVQDISAFCAEVRGRMAHATVEQMREIFEVLRLALEVTVEDAQKIVYATCALGDTRIRIASTTGCSHDS